MMQNFCFRDFLNLEYLNRVFIFYRLMIRLAHWLVEDIWIMM
jgi:hypothetical protein